MIIAMDDYVHIHSHMNLYLENALRKSILLLSFLCVLTPCPHGLCQHLWSADSLSRENIQELQSKLLNTYVNEYS